jgi:hypothetical protein
MARRKGLAEELLERGVRLAIEAAEKVIGDPRGREAIGLASELAQKAVKKLEELQAAAVKAVGVPSRDEYRELRVRVDEIQRKARDLAARLDAMDRDARREPGPGGGTGRTRWRDPDDSEPR